jgi:beta-N-acetylhexosaminidase
LLSAAEGGPVRAAIVGLAGERLLPAERSLFRRLPPAGFILFRRNCGAPEQLLALVAELRGASPLPDPPILIDQEGGRVARMRPPHWPARCAAGRVGALAAASDAAGEPALEAAWLHARLIAADLAPLGITVNCAPVLDLAMPEQTRALGDRTYCARPEAVGALGRAAIEGYLAGGILPVVKHLPGHGRATVDSHLELPRVEAGAEVLAAADWLPFIACNDAPFGMTAHILYAGLDPERPATQSARVIDHVIRDRIGFNGALLSDDLSMEALGGGLGDRAALARAAGCDLALHCNGDLAEMTAVLEAAGPLEGIAAARLEAALARRTAARPFDAQAGERRLAALLDAGESAA